MSLMVHLWQSTVCVGIAALLALALRQASARTRHGIWLLASLKFFVPLSLFVVAGRHIGLLTWPLAIPEGSIAIRWLDRSLSLWNLDAVTGSNGTWTSVRHGPPWTSGAGARLGLRRRRYWRRGDGGSGRACRGWHVPRPKPIADGKRRSCSASLGRRGARNESSSVTASPAAEPGVLGIFRPTAAMAGRTLGSVIRRRARGHSHPRSVSRRSARQHERLDPHGGRDRVLVSPPRLVARSATRERARARV